MREPPATTRLLGHPLVVWPLTIASFAMLFACLQTDTNIVLPGLLVFVVLGKTAKAAEARAAYLAWKRAWNGMAESAPAARMGQWRRPLGIVLALAILLGVIAHADDAPYQLALLWIALGGTVAIAVAVWRRKRLPRNARTEDVVRICARPMMAVPSLTDAYKALPDHCWDVLGR